MRGYLFALDEKNKNEIRCVYTIYNMGTHYTSKPNDLRDIDIQYPSVVIQRLHQTGNRRFVWQPYEKYLK